jgi:aminoglycoside phosphotransferase (APT) family kinase protein
MPRNALSQADYDDVRQIASRCLGSVLSVDPIPSQQNVVCRIRLRDGSRRILEMAPRPGSSRSRGRRSDENVAREPSAYRRLRAAGIPAPTIYCGEKSDGRIGRAWFACDDLGRRTAADGSGLSNAGRRHLFGQIGKFLARVHDLPDDGDHQTPRLSPLIAWQHHQIRRGLAGGVFRDAAIETYLSDLLETDRPGTTTGRCSLCHGDYHAAQCVRRGGRLVAAVDWESSHWGDAGDDHAAFEIMMRVTVPAEVAQVALDAYAASRPFFDASRYETRRTAHAAALTVAFHDVRRHAYARSARHLLRQASHLAAAA